MIALILSTICAALISILFKIFKQRGVDSNPAIVYNYLTAMILGLILSIDTSNGIVNPVAMEWFLPALGTGLIFIGGMIAMSFCTIRTGVVISSVASRASMIIPILLNYLLIPGSKKPEWITISIMIVAMFMIINKGETSKGKGAIAGIIDILAPLSVFLLYGLSSSFLKLVQYSISTKSSLTDLAINQQLSMVSFTIFAGAMVAGIVLLAIDRNSSIKMLLEPKNIIGGITLGACNFFCTYLLMVSMKSLNTEFLFPVHNVGVVVLGAIAGWGFYHEKMKPHQLIGFIIAAIAIFFL
ncbi:MAG: EamA family transporter [Bacteroidaceae bacterium]|nr:EamA family transporter [Bacteroidaceae bacterium]